MFFFSRAEMARLAGAVLLMAASCAAFAQDAKPQVWTSSAVAGEFPSQQAALAAVRAQGGVYAFAENVEDFLTTETAVTYVYGSKQRDPDISPWKYTLTYADPELPSEEAALASVLANLNASYPGCEFVAVEPVDEWTVTGSWYNNAPVYGGRSYRAQNVNLQSCSEYWSFSGSRARSVACPAGLGWNAVEKACVQHDIARINSKPMPCPPCELQHNPVSVSTGGKVQSEGDFVLSWLDFSRHYHSTHTVPEGRLGPGWTHDLNIRLFINGSSGAGVLMPRGEIVHFRYLSGIYEAVDGSGWRLSPVSGGYRLDMSGQVLKFNSLNRLSQIERQSGEIVQVQYDSNGRLSAAVLYSIGRSVNFEYEASAYPANARLTAIKSDSVALVSYEYDSAGRLEYARYANGTARRYHYENVAFPTHLTGISDETGTRYATFGYNADGLATLSEHAGGLYRGTFDYQADGTTVYTDANGRVQTYGFTTDGAYRKIIEIADTAGVQSTTYALAADDFRRRPVSRVDKRGVQKTYAYLDYADATLGNVRRTTTIEAVGTPQARTLVTWRDQATTWLLKSTASGKETVYQRNGRGQPLIVTERDTATGTTRTTTTTYCEQVNIDAGTCPRLGLVTAINGPRTDVSDVTTYTYYPSDDASCATAPTTCPHRKGDLWLVQDAAGNITETLKYDGAGRVLSVKDANGVITDFEYHPRGWLTARKVRGTDSASEADDQISRIDYYPTGLVQKTTLPDGSFTSYTYDAAHRLTDITDGEGNTIHYTLDNAGNRTKEDTKDSAGTLVRTLSRVYNQLGRLQTHKDAYQHATGYSYDANGNTDQVTDALSRVTDNDYDPLNRLSKTIQNVGGLNVTTQFRYDARDNLTAVIDPKGLTTGYTYNGLGDLSQLSSPDTGVTAYTYDSAGNRQTQTDARGVTATYGYDALNRLATISYPDSSLNIGYAYDTVAIACASGETFAAGRLSQLTDGSGSTQYCYDRFGHLVRKVQATAGQTLTVRYAYSNAGQLSAVTYPDGTVADYVRDTHGRTREVGVIRPGQPREVLLTAAGYHPFGPPSEWVFGNGRLFQRSLNQNYQPGVIQDQAPGGLSVGYEFDAVGNLVKLRNGHQNDPPLRLYGYDPLNRLTSAQDGTTQAFTEGYTYDATGNRTSATIGATTTAYTLAPTSHRLTAVGGSTRVYDNAGNTTTIAGRDFVYNAANRMSAVQQAGVTAMSYAYNSKGEQVRRANGSASTLTVYDEAGHWLGEYDGTGVPSQQVVWLDDLPVGLIVGAAAANQPLHYIEADALGTPRVVIEPQRNVAVWRWELVGEAFGNDAPNADPDGDGTSLVFNLRFPGQRYDAESGLNHNGFREYETNGRYIQSDPIGLRGGISTYGYVEQNPLTKVDPTGEAAVVLPAPVTLPGIAEVCLAGPAGAVACGGVGGYATGTVLYPLVSLPLADAIDATCGDKCSSIYADINAALSELKKRYWDMRLDQYDMFMKRRNGPRMTWESHQRQFQSTQRFLRRSLEAADKIGCSAYPSDAWNWATRPPPTAPAPK